MASGEDRGIEKRVSAWSGNAERLRAALLSGDVNQSNDGWLSMQCWVPATESSVRTGAALSAGTAAGICLGCLCFLSPLLQTQDSAVLQP